jgi:uncharacterized protein
MLTAPDEKIWIGILRLEIAFPYARSKKDKRRQIEKLRSRYRARYNLSIAEVGHLENIKRSVIAISVVGNDSKKLRSFLDIRGSETHSIIDGSLQSIHIKIFPYSPEFL